jgi:PAS domain S-box-containing protein
MDLKGRFQSCNPAYVAMLGFSEEELRACASPDLVHPEDREANIVEIRRLLSEQIPSFEIVNRYICKDGVELWVHKHGSLLRDACGRPSHIIALVTDISERKRHEEHTQLLLREVNHRSKNMLSLVQSIAHLTAATGPQDFVKRFGERIRSLSAAQDLLIKHEWKAVPLADLIRLQLSHFADLIGGRIALSGSPLSISQAASQTIGMALHELATNAAKYGALSNEAGRIAITWNLESNGAAEPKFTMSWVERDGPPVVKPLRRGFGSKVTCRMVESAVSGGVSVDYAPSGLVWRLECPAGSIIDGHHVSSVADKPPLHVASGRRVLVVEDEPLIAAEIADILELAGFQVIGPASGVKEALRLLEREGCDTAVLDVNLGAETSEPITRELIRIGTPFVVLSGYSREQLPVSFRLAPLIHKPLQATVL